jgi:hypothetical protein
MKDTSKKKTASKATKPENAPKKQLKGFAYEIADPITKGTWRLLSNHEEDPADLLTRIEAFVTIFKLLERPKTGTITTLYITPKHF